MACRWNDLGTLTGPGNYPIKDVGMVEVIQDDIDRAADMGGNPSLTLEDVFVHSSKERNFVIRFMRPGSLTNYPSKQYTNGYS